MTAERDGWGARIATGSGLPTVEELDRWEDTYLNPEQGKRLISAARLCLTLNEENEALRSELETVRGLAE